jgi:eukaryotic-like serine/threonine-protein kinase
VRFIAWALVLALALSIPVVASDRSEPIAAAPVSVSVLFDLGDGTYFWAHGTIANPAATNATWNAVQAAATSLGLWISWIWYSGSFGSGIFVTDIGNRSPPAVGLFVWNRTADVWDVAQVGVSALVVKDGDAIALTDTDYNRVTYNPYPPAATPLSPFPVAEFRGDLANRGSTLSAAPYGVRVAWDRNLRVPEIGSTPVVVGGHAYILTEGGLFALDESTGADVWSTSSVKGLSTPAFFNGTVLVGGADGRVHDFAATTGTELWNVTVHLAGVLSDITSSPKLLFDTAYLGTFNESGGAGDVAALWATNGTIRWRHMAPGSVHFSSPAVANDTVFVGIMGRLNTTTQITYNPPYGVLALNATSGAQRWFVPLNASVAASPAIAGGTLFVPAKNGYLYALDPVTGRTRWQRAVSAGVSSPAVHGGTVFVAGGAGSFGGPGLLTALDATTGATLWTFVPNGVVQSSVTFASGLLLFSTNVANGTMYAVSAATGNEVWSYTPSPAQYILGSPVVADGMVIAPSDNGHVYAFAASPGPLLNLTAAVSGNLTAGNGVEVSLALRAATGLATDVMLNVSLFGLANLTVTPAPAAISGLNLSWHFDSIPFGTTVVLRAYGRAVCPSRPPSSGSNVVGCGPTGVIASLHATYRDAGGVGQGPIVQSFSPSYWTESAPQQGFGSVVVFLGAAAGVVVVLAVLVLFIRRRRRGGNTGGA